jgi:hypothetical protein
MFLGMLPPIADLGISELAIGLSVTGLVPWAYVIKELRKLESS